MDRNDFIQAWMTSRINNGRPVTYQDLAQFVTDLGSKVKPDLKSALLQLLPQNKKLPLLRVEVVERKKTPEKPKINLLDYAPRFREGGDYYVKQMAEIGLDPWLANTYSYYYQTWHVIAFHRRGLGASETAPYAVITSERFWHFEDGLCDLIEAHFPIKKLQSFPAYLLPGTILHLDKNGKGPKDIPQYSQRFPTKIANFNYVDRASINSLIENDVPSNIADSYDRKFNGINIGQLYKAGINPDQTKEYVASRFNGDNATHLLVEKIPLTEALKYPSKYDGKQIAKLHKAGKSGDYVTGHPDDPDIETIIKK